MTAAFVPTARQDTIRAIVWRRFRQHRPAVAGLAVLGVIVGGSFLAPLVIGVDPYATHIELRRQPPSLEHLFGTDELGRDLLMRIWVGGQVSLLIGVAAMGISITIGTLVGGVAGFYGRWLGNGLMRLADILLSLPQLLVLLLFAQLIRTSDLAGISGGPLPIIFIIGILSWMGAARIVRGEFLSLRAREFVDAARVAGAANGRIMWRHILPNAASPIIVAASLRVGNAILTESTLSFLGFGVQPPMPSWGNLLRNAQSQMTAAPWIAIFPGLAIIVTVLAINYVGDGLRDALDPRHVERQ